jgi:hypothetical protein
MTAAAKPGQREGGGARACDLVLMEGGSTWAAAVATWALVRAQGGVLVGVAALRSRAARCFLMHSCLAKLVGMLVGITLLCTLGTDGCASMEHVILLLSSVWVAGILGGICTLGTRCMLGVCTLGTCCMLGVAKGVAMSLNWLGRACTWASVASIIHWRSCAA